MITWWILVVSESTLNCSVHAGEQMCPCTQMPPAHWLHLHAKCKMKQKSSRTCEQRMLSSSAAAPAEHDSHGEDPGCWQNQPHLSRYNKRNVSPTPGGPRRALSSPCTLILWQIKQPLSSIMRGMKSNPSIFFFKLHLITWIWQQFIVCGPGLSAQRAGIYVLEHLWAKAMFFSGFYSFLITVCLLFYTESARDRIGSAKQCFRAAQFSAEPKWVSDFFLMQC